MHHIAIFNVRNIRSPRSGSVLHKQADSNQHLNSRGGLTKKLKVCVLAIAQEDLLALTISASTKQ